MFSDRCLSSPYRLRLPLKEKLVGVLLKLMVELSTSNGLSM